VRVGADLGAAAVSLESAREIAIWISIATVRGSLRSAATALERSPSPRRRRGSRTGMEEIAPATVRRWWKSGCRDAHCVSSCASARNSRAVSSCRMPVVAATAASRDCAGGKGVGLGFVDQVDRGIGSRACDNSSTSGRTRALAARLPAPCNAQHYLSRTVGEMFIAPPNASRAACRLPANAARRRRTARRCPPSG